MLPLAGLLGIGTKLIDKLIPDPAAKADAKLKLLELEQTGGLAELDAEVKLALGQLEVNKIEAASSGWFKGGWRPFTGWTCASALAYKFIVYPLIVSTVQIIAHFTKATPVPLELLPVISVTELIPILLGMLGLGAYRSYERVKGVIPKG